MTSGILTSLDAFFLSFRQSGTTPTDGKVDPRMSLEENSSLGQRARSAADAYFSFRYGERAVLGPVSTGFDLSLPQPIQPSL